MTKKMRFFKFLEKGHFAPYTGYDYSKFIPKDGKPGPWMKAKGRPSICANGFHACQAKNVGEWVDQEMYEVEFRGKLVGATRGDKVVGCEMRFLRRIPSFSLKRFFRFRDRMEDLFYRGKITSEEYYPNSTETYILKLADSSK